MTDCPNCGSTMAKQHGTYRFEPPSNIPGGTMSISDATWLECENCGEQLLPAELDRKLEELSMQRQGLLLPAQIKAIREKLGLTQAAMSERLGVGEKTYTRWESGRSMQNKSSDNLIRLMDRVPEEFAAIEAQRDPMRQIFVANYFKMLSSMQGANQWAMAAHDASLSLIVVNNIRHSLKESLATSFKDASGEWAGEGLVVEHLAPTDKLWADTPELETNELVNVLLNETGQAGDTPTNPAVILEYLKLQLAVLDLASVSGVQKKRPRGVLSYLDRIVGIDQSLQTTPQRARFTTLHEVAHYILPSHQRDLWVCDEQDVSFDATAEKEIEANEVAADLLFKGEMFTREANDFAITPESIKSLALRYDASFEATARRFVERNARACGLAVFAPASGSSVIDTSRPGRWQHRYTISSSEFRTHYFLRLWGQAPTEVIKKLVVPGRDFADGIDDEVTVESASGDKHRLRMSFFTNHHCVFGLLQPVTKGKQV